MIAYSHSRVKLLHRSWRELLTSEPLATLELASRLFPVPNADGLEFDDACPVPFNSNTLVTATSSRDVRRDLSELTSGLTMIYYFQVALRAERDNGDAIGRQEFKQAIPLDLAGYTCEGFGEEERAILVIGCELSAESFKDSAAYARFLAKLEKQVIKFATSLSAVSAARVRKFAASGVSLDLVATFACDDGDLELILPPQFLAAAGKLGLPLVIGPIEKDYN